LGAKRVVLVDGDPDSRSVYSIVLTYHGYSVEAYADGAVALCALEEEHPADVVVTELTLRQVDGHTLIERLRAAERTREVSIIVVTARGLKEDRQRAEQAGCTRFMLKPVEPQALAREVEAVLSGR
jgi:two-component system, OmpR family, phosphate regulon response regulator PhoB